MHPAIQKAIEAATARGFYGCIEIIFKDGTPTVVHSKRTTQLDSRAPMNGSANDNRY